MANEYVDVPVELRIDIAVVMVVIVVVCLLQSVRLRWRWRSDHLRLAIFYYCKQTRSGRALQWSVRFAAVLLHYATCTTHIYLIQKARAMTSWACCIT